MGFDSVKEYSSPLVGELSHMAEGGQAEPQGILGQNSEGISDLHSYRVKVRYS